MSELLTQLEALLPQKKSKAFYADKLGITIDQVEELLKELKQDDESSDQWEKRVNADKGTIESSLVTDFEPKGTEELYDLHKIDKSLYKISTYWSKLKSNGKFTSSVLASLKKANEFSPEDFAKFLTSYSPTPLEVQIKQSEGKSEFVDVVISIADFHLDRQTLKGDKIENRKEEYLTVLKSLVSSVFYKYGIDRFVFVIGNDFFNNDNYQGTTTNGTPQDNSVDWNRAYEEGFDLLVKSISLLAAVSNNVEVMLVQGNHDRTKSFYLAHALEIFFASNHKVYFKRHSSNTKFTQVGCTFIGFHHGNTKIDELPLLFATSPDTSIAFGTSKYREVHTADKHYYMAKEVKGVRIQQMPSMVNPDRWSNDGLYLNNVRAGLAIVFHPTKGRVAEFEERI